MSKTKKRKKRTWQMSAGIKNVTVNKAVIKSNGIEHAKDVFYVSRYASWHSKVSWT